LTDYSYERLPTEDDIYFVIGLINNTIFFDENDRNSLTEKFEYLKNCIYGSEENEQLKFDI
jgi:hypothetical protein